MSISSISRYGIATPDTVAIVSDNTLEELTTPGYFDQIEIIQDIYRIWGNEFIWNDTDQVMIYYPSTIGYFMYDRDNNCFKVLSL